MHYFLSLAPRRWLRILVGIAVGLTLISLLFKIIFQFALPAAFAGRGTLALFLNRWNIGGDPSVPAFYSSLTLLMAAALLAAIAHIKWRRRDAFRLHWTGLALGFLAMGIEETVGFHEIVSRFLYRSFNTDGVLRHPWVIPGLILIAAIGLMYGRFLLRLPAATRRTFVVAGLMYVGGVVGAEMLGGHYQLVHALENSVPPVSKSGPMFVYILIMHLEDLLEMLGAAVFIYGLLDYLEPIGVRFQISIGAGTGEDRSDGDAVSEAETAADHARELVF